MGVYSHQYHKHHCLSSEPRQQPPFFVPPFPALPLATPQSAWMARTQSHSKVGSRGATAPATGSGNTVGRVTAAKWQHQNRDATQEPIFPALQHLQDQGSHHPSLIRASLMSWVYTRLQHNGLMSVKALETQKSARSNNGHASSSPAPAKSLQSALHNAQLVWCSPVRNGFQAAHGIISDRRWIPLLAACHSSKPPRNSSTTAAHRHKKTSSSSPKFFVIGLSTKPKHKVRKDWHLFQMAPCTQ